MKTMKFFRCAMPLFAAAFLASCACENELGKQFDPAFRTSVKVLGTLNDYTDKDDGWIIEAAIPFKMLEDFTGVKFASDGRWTILLARYNYNFGQEVRELSAAPQLPYDNFHLTEYYAELIFK